jgi:hypothetical protein
MKLKFFAAAVSLCFAVAILSAPARAEQIDSHSPHETASLTGAGNTSQNTGNTEGNSALNLLDAVWIFGVSVAGLILLRKIQGE